MKKAIKILVLVILGVIALLPGITLFNSDCVGFTKVLNAINLFWEALIIFSLAMINWWPEDNNESDGRTDWFSNKDDGN